MLNWVYTRFFASSPRQPSLPEKVANSIRRKQAKTKLLESRSNNVILHSLHNQAVSKIFCNAVWLVTGTTQLCRTLIRALADDPKLLASFYLQFVAPVVGGMPYVTQTQIVKIPFPHDYPVGTQLDIELYAAHPLFYKAIEQDLCVHTHQGRKVTMKEGAIYPQYLKPDTYYCPWDVTPEIQQPANANPCLLHESEATVYMNLEDFDGCKDGRLQTSPGKKPKVSFGFSDGQHHHFKGRMVRHQDIEHPAAEMLPDCDHTGLKRQSNNKPKALKN